jgi:hypothetical protein
MTETLQSILYLQGNSFLWKMLMTIFCLDSYINQ